MSDFIFTTHARQRLQQRSIPIGDAELVLRQPAQTFPGKKVNTTKFVRNVGGRNIQLVATYLQDQKKWLVVSAWVRGEEDRVPLVWHILVAPFKLMWWLIKKVVR